MNRILTILLLPLLLMSTSCDSDDSSECAINNPTGSWTFTQWDYTFSGGCAVGEDGSALDDFLCVDITILQDNIDIDPCECDREACEEDSYPYECSGSDLTFDGDTWTIDGNTATMTVTEPIEDSIYCEGNDCSGYGEDCMITSILTITKD